MDSATKVAIRLIVLTALGLLMIGGCAGPRWTGLSDIKKKEMAPEHDTIRITSKPSGAKVFVEERQVGITPLSFQLSFRRIKCYRENLLMDGDKIVDRTRLDYGMEYIPDSYHIKISKPGYKVSFLKHKGDNQNGRYHANIVLQNE
ncbi:MAG: PEGA domain-containing protein [Deltaproteobacteria bacterium]|nr:PEGA domain-containing protein [Deltaproteobacteria bacterium]